MSAHVIDEFLVLGKYRVMALDQDVHNRFHVCYFIDGRAYPPVHLRGKQAVQIPGNFIAIKTTRSFQGAPVEIS